ncbi:hypothetical protein ACE6H2_010683 [Prunus campanulata]
MFPIHPCIYPSTHIQNIQNGPRGTEVTLPPTRSPQLLVYSPHTHKHTSYSRGSPPLNDDASPHQQPLTPPLPPIFHPQFQKSHSSISLSLSLSLNTQSNTKQSNDLS